VEGEEDGGLRDEKSGAARGQAGPVAACGRGAGGQGRRPLGERSVGPGFDGLLWVRFFAHWTIS